MKRAITLTGTSRAAAGLHIGALGHFSNVGMEFDIWSLSNIGSWVGVVYNQSEEGSQFRQTYEYFQNDQRFKSSAFYATSSGRRDYNFDEEILSNFFLPNIELARTIKFDHLYQDVKPQLIYNAWNITKQYLSLFSNKSGAHAMDYKEIDMDSLLANSILPFFGAGISIDGDQYCGGLSIDTANFRRLLRDHPDIDEIWISRIVDSSPIGRALKSPYSLASLFQLLAGAIVDDDVKLFKYHVRYDRESGRIPWKGTIVEISIDSDLDLHLSGENLDDGVERGRRAAEAAYNEYMRVSGGKRNDTDEVRFISVQPDEYIPRTFESSVYLETDSKDRLDELLRATRNFVTFLGYDVEPGGR